MNDLILVDASHFLLSCTYVIIGIITIYLRFGTQYSNQKLHRGLWQKTFTIGLLVGIICMKIFYTNFLNLKKVRSISFFLQPFNSAEIVLIPNSIIFIIVSLPSFLFLSCYMIILFLWAEIYHDINGADTSNNNNKISIFYFSIQTIIYIVVIILFIIDLNLNLHLRKNQVSASSIYQTVILLIDASLYIATALGFLVYGISFYLKFNEAKDILFAKIRLTILPKVKYFTILCSFCFLTRGALTFWSAFQNWSDAYWWIDFTYYLTLEILPIILMLFILKPSSEIVTNNNNRLINENSSSDSE